MEYLQASREDFEVLMKYNLMEGMRKDIIDLVLGSEGNKKLDLGAIAGVMGGIRIDWVKFAQFYTMPYDEVISCLKCFMTLRPSNPVVYVDAVVRCFRLGHPSEIGKLRQFIRGEGMKYANSLTFVKEIRELNRVEEMALSDGKRMGANQIKIMNNAFETFVSTLESHNVIRKGNMYHLKDIEDNVFGVFEANMPLISADIESKRVISACVKIGPNVSKRIGSLLSDSIDALCSNVPFVVDSIYFYGLDGMSTYEFNPKWIDGYVIPKGNDNAVLLV